MWYKQKEIQTILNKNLVKITEININKFKFNLVNLENFTNYSIIQIIQFYFRIILTCIFWLPEKSPFGDFSFFRRKGKSENSPKKYFFFFFNPMLEFLKTQRGAKMLKYEGFLYVIDKKYETKQDGGVENVVVLVSCWLKTNSCHL
jgi:hypothetical protein